MSGRDSEEDFTIRAIAGWRRGGCSRDPGRPGEKEQSSGARLCFKAVYSTGDRPGRKKINLKKKPVGGEVGEA